MLQLFIVTILHDTIEAVKHFSRETINFELKNKKKSPSHIVTKIVGKNPTESKPFIANLLLKNGHPHRGLCSVLFYYYCMQMVPARIKLYILV